MLRNESTYKLPLNKTTYRAIKMQTGTSIDVEKFLEDCIKEYTDSESNTGLFNTDSKSFWSDSLLRRMEKYEALKEKRSQAGKKAMQNRWGKQNDNKAITTKQKKKIKGILKNDKPITVLSKKDNKVITLVIKNNSKLITKNNKLNQIKLNKIKLNKIKSIYPSYHPSNTKEEINENEDVMDEIDRSEFNEIINKSEVRLYNQNLANEIINVMQEIYLNPGTKRKLKNIKLGHIDLALQNYSKAKENGNIKMPKRYFKQCLISVLDELELSQVYNLDGS